MIDILLLIIQCQSSWLLWTYKLATHFFIWIECSEGLYGVNCSQECKGHCREGVTCNHVTGLCDRGCADGWTGSDCEIGKRVNQYCW